MSRSLVVPGAREVPEINTESWFQEAYSPVEEEENNQVSEGQ